MPASETRPSVRKKTEEEVKAESAKIEANTKNDACSWCEYEGEHPQTGEKKEKQKSKVLFEHGIHQCLTCGKVWPRQALGKPWTLELEMGDAWVRETAARKLFRS